MVTVGQHLTEGFLNKSVHTILAPASTDLVLQQHCPSPPLRFHFLACVSNIFDQVIAGVSGIGKSSI